MSLEHLNRIEASSHHEAPVHVCLPAWISLIRFDVYKQHANTKCSHTLEYKKEFSQNDTAAQ